MLPQILSVLVLLFQLTLAQFQTYFSAAEIKAIYRPSDDKVAYVSTAECPVEYIFEPDPTEWTLFCQYAQGTDTYSFLQADEQSEAAAQLTTDNTYKNHYCTAPIVFSEDGALNCCCETQTMQTSLSTQGLTAVIVAPVVFLLAGLIMYKWNHHNSQEAWKERFDQILQKA